MQFKMELTEDTMCDCGAEFKTDQKAIEFQES